MGLNGPENNVHPFGKFFFKFLSIAMGIVKTLNRAKEQATYKIVILSG